MTYKIGDLVTVEIHPTSRRGRVVSTRHVASIFGNRAHEIYLVRYEGTDTARWCHPLHLSSRKAEEI